MMNNDTDTNLTFINAIQAEDIKKLDELYANQSIDIDRFIFGSEEYLHNALTFAMTYRCQKSVQWLIEKKVDVNCTKYVSEGIIPIPPLALAIFTLELCNHKPLSTKLNTLLLSTAKVIIRHVEQKEDQQIINQSIIQESIDTYMESIPATNHDDVSIAILSNLISAESMQFESYKPVTLEENDKNQHIASTIISSRYSSYILKALAQGNIDELDTFIKHLNELNYPFSKIIDILEKELVNTFDETFLLFSIAAKQIHSVRWLIENGADINQTNKSGLLPLCAALSLSAKKTEKMPINQSIIKIAMGNQPSSNDRQKEKDIVNFLLAQQEIQLDVVTSVKSITSQSIAKQLEEKDDGNILKKFSMMFTVDPTDKNHFPIGEGLTPLILAMRCGHEDIVMAMLAKIEKLELTKSLLHLNTCSSTHGSALSNAINMGMHEVVNKLIALGVDVNIKTSMFCGELSESLPTANTFDSPGPNNELSNMLMASSTMMRSKLRLENISSIILAAKAGMIDVVMHLRSLGHKLNESCDMNVTPLRIAAEYNRIEMVALILKYLKEDDVNINAQCETYYTPLLIALESKHKEIAAMLIEAGADWSITNNPGHSPLGYVVAHGFDEIFDQMAAQGINLSEHSHYGDSILELAIKCQRDAIVEKLYQMGLSKYQDFLLRTINKCGKYSVLLLTNRLDNIISDRLGTTPEDRHHRELKCLLLNKLNEIFPAEDKCALTKNATISFNPVTPLSSTTQSENKESESSDNTNKPSRIMDGTIVEFLAPKDSNAVISEDKIEYNGMIFEKNKILLEKIITATNELMVSNTDIKAKINYIEAKNDSIDYSSNSLFSESPKASNTDENQITTNPSQI